MYVEETCILSHTVSLYMHTYTKTRKRKSTPLRSEYFWSKQFGPREGSSCSWLPGAKSQLWFLRHHPSGRAVQKVLCSHSSPPQCTSHVRSKGECTLCASTEERDGGRQHSGHHCHLNFTGITSKTSCIPWKYHIRNETPRCVNSIAASSKIFS